MIRYFHVNSARLMKTTKNVIIVIAVIKSSDKMQSGQIALRRKISTHVSHNENTNAVTAIASISHPAGFMVDRRIIETPASPAISR